MCRQWHETNRQLRRIAELLKDVHAKLSSPGKRALFNLLRPSDSLSHDEEEKLVERVS